MHTESLRHRYLLRVVVPTLRLMGPRLTDRLARMLGRAVFGLQTPARSVAEERIRVGVAPDTATPSVASTCLAMYEQIGRFWAESVFLRRMQGRRCWSQRVAIDQRRRLEALIQSSRGCIFTTPLFGNPAVAALSLGHLCRPIHVVADIPAMPRFDIWRRALCPSPMIELVARRDAARRLPDILGRGGSIFLLTADHRSSGLAVATEFLGRPIRCRPTPGRLAAWYDAPVVVVTCKRRPAAWRFTFDVHDVIDPRARSDGASAITLRALRAAEKAIRAAPEQYLWALPGERPRTGGAVTDTEIESASYPRRNQTTMAWRRPSMAGRRRRGRAAATVHVPMA